MFFDPLGLQDENRVVIALEDFDDVEIAFFKLFGQGLQHFGSGGGKVIAPEHFTVEVPVGFRVEPGEHFLKLLESNGFHEPGKFAARRGNGNRKKAQILAP